MAQPYNYDERDPHAPAPYIDVQAALILALVVIIVVLVARFNATASISGTVTTAPISTPAIPTPAPIYYQPVPTLYPIAPASERITRDDHRICVFVIDCSQH